MIRSLFFAYILFAADVFSSDMAVLVVNDTNQRISIDRSKFHCPSTISDIWYKSSLNSNTISPKSSKKFFITVDDTDTDKGYIRLLFPDHINFFDIVFVKISGWAGIVFAPLLQFETKNAEHSPVISGSYKGAQTTNSQDKTIVISIMDC